MALAKQLGIDEYSQPAGGCCFLTDEHYSRKLADLWDARGERRYEVDDIMLLKVGRHIRPAKNFKVIISREEGENNFLSGYKREFTTIRCLSHPGPIALVDGSPNENDLELAARLVARYGKARTANKAAMQIDPKGGEGFVLEIPPYPADEIPQEWYV